MTAETNIDVWHMEGLETARLFEKAVLQAIDVCHLEGLEAARLFEGAVLLAIEQNDVFSAFFLLAKLRSFLLGFLLSLDASLSPQREECCSILTRLDKSVLEAISS